MSTHKNIWIFDFFAGPGYDLNGIPGSPIRLLAQIDSQVGNIFQQKLKLMFALMNSTKTNTIY